MSARLAPLRGLRGGGGLETWLKPVPSRAESRGGEGGRVSPTAARPAPLRGLPGWGQLLCKSGWSGAAETSSGPRVASAPTLTSVRPGPGIDWASWRGGPGLSAAHGAPVQPPPEACHRGCPSAGQT
ncbi:hypothetical protein NDU88_009075 [Pleurodeles waltl]|uniref:Uncharacterized protein n=1 Tax=Pleurodeles waltl TaxID=8319 RepID=A0AAV7P5F3_PLEWA|nr:hypothetical protein NDU88_009075 [Pleurodeles waltl]